MAYSIFLRDALLNHVFRATAYTAPSSVYCALLTTNPSDDAGTGLVEVTTTQWTNYARQAITGATGSWNAPPGGTSSPQAITNITVANFGTATIASSTIVTGYAMYDAATAGNLLMWVTLTGGNKTINNSDPVSIPAGNLTVNE